MWRRVTPPSAPSGWYGRGGPPGEGKKKLCAGGGPLRDDPIGLLDQVIYLFLAGPHVVEVVLVADVGRPDQVPPVPRHDEVRPAVFLRLDVESGLWSTGERVHHEVTPFGPPDHALLATVHPGEYLVHPGTGHVEDHWGVGRVSPTAQQILELHTRGPAALDHDAVHLRVGEHDGAVLLGGDSVLHGDALGVLHLGVVVECGPLESLGIQSRVTFQGLLPAVDVVVLQTLVVGERTVGNHAELYHYLPPRHVIVYGDQET